MVTVEFSSERVVDASLKVNINQSGNLALKNKFSFSTYFSVDGKSAKAILSLSVFDDNEKFAVHTETEGYFTIKGIETDTDRKVVNTKCFDKLFEHAAGHVSTLAEMGGIKNLPIPKPEFGFDDIQVNYAHTPSGMTS